MGAVRIHHAAHSTTGWKTVERSGCPEHDPICDGTAHIFNSHDKLVEALEAASNAICATHCEEEHHLSCEQARAALEEAKP